ncbi:MAG: hypothetical protein AAF481_06995 [Acidobacteriota bacterium]
MLESLLRQPDFWPNFLRYASIPVVAAVVGWGTNWLAIKLTFHPLEFKGIRPFLGWQGIIPSKAAKMAGTFAEKTMFRLGTLPELFEEMEPERISHHVTRSVDPHLPRWTDEVMYWSGQGALWRRVPKLVKEQIYLRVREEMPGRIEALVREVGRSVDELIDFKVMLVGHLSRDKKLLNRLFIESGRAEFKFLVRSGFYFGFLFGLVQLAVWLLLPAAWVLPVFGLIVGWATNWIALNLIFRPLHPVRFGPWTLHGLFLRRQKEVAAIWCHLVTREIVTVRQIMRAMVKGPRAERSRELIRRHIEPVMESSLGSLLPAAQVTLGSDGYAAIRRAIGDKAVEVAAEPFDHWGFIEERALVVEEMLRQRMESLPSEEFQNLLRPCFQEDEIKLILTGAVLGFLAGLGQLVFVFGGG